jgi:hypothetical protein
MNNFISRHELIPGKWYVCNLSPPFAGRQSLDVCPDSDYLDFALGGPFDSDLDANKWLKNHPQYQGIFDKIIRAES